MNDPRDEALFEAFARCIASLASTRTQLRVREGAHVSDVDANPPVSQKNNPRCRSCKRPSFGRLLCSACRSNPSLEEGDPLVHVMYRSSNKKFDILPGSNKEEILLILHAQKGLAIEAYQLAEELNNWSGSVYRRHQQTFGACKNTVYFTPERVKKCASYRKALPCGAPSSLGRPLLVGGLGPRLHAAVREYVLDWLYAMDAAFRKEYAIPLSRDVGDNSLMANLSSFATLITNRVVLMEEEAVDDPTQRLCSLGCEHLASIQYLRCQYHAAARVKRDVNSMRLLRKLATESCSSSPARSALDDASAVPHGSSDFVDVSVDETRTALLELLDEPPPELLKGLLTVSADMNFAELRDAVGLLPSEGLEATVAAVAAWRASVNVEFLCMRLDTAITVANTWRPGFLNCLVTGNPRSVRAMPKVSWVDPGPEAAFWRLLPNAAHRQRRTGLDPTGLRIVLVSAAIMQLMACESPVFFAPGEVRCELVNAATHASMEGSLYAIEALRDQMRPLAVGVEWMSARGQMQSWRSSHIDAHVHRAFAELGGFSFEELCSKFLGDVETVCDACGGRATQRNGCRNSYCNCRSVTTQRTISESVVQVLLPRVKNLMLPVRPKAGYDSWLALTVKVSMPMLLHLRQSLGFGTTVRTNPAGDWLRTFPEFRSWKPTDGPISLTAGEVYDVPQVKELLVRAHARGEGLAQKKRVKTKNEDKFYWHFNSERLSLVLGSSS